MLGVFIHQPGPYRPLQGQFGFLHPLRGARGQEGTDNFIQYPKEMKYANEIHRKVFLSDCRI